MRVQALIIGLLLLLHSCSPDPSPRVFVFTDINIDQGDPDDRQSLLHLLWYADELDIEGVVPDRWSAEGYQACELALEAYRKDYQEFQFSKSGHPAPENIEPLIAKDSTEALRLFVAAAQDRSSPLYVLIWGNMQLFQSALATYPEVADNIRLITIGTGLMLEKHLPEMPASWPKSPPCQQLNWNGFGRQAVYDDPRFEDMWWLEINWTYAGMFRGKEPGILFNQLSSFGSMGQHMKDVVKNQARFQYFRVGDTPSVLYLLDQDHSLADPTQSSWAGQFVKPFTTERPNYYTDRSDGIQWNYADPCQTWANHEQVNEAAQATLLSRRPEMYYALLSKLDRLYKK